MSRTTILHAQLEARGCTAELFLNGIPVVRIAPEYMPITNAAVEDLVVPGDNTLELLVEPGSHPGVARSEVSTRDFSPMSAVARLIRFEDGAPGLAEYGDVLAETSYTWKQAPPDTRDFPASATTSVNLGSANGRWGWQDAPVLSQSEALTDEACAVMDAIETAIVRGDTNMLLQIIDHKIQDTLRALPAYTAASLSAEIASMMQDVSAGNDPVPARSREAHDFRLVAGGRMLQLVDRDYRPSMGVNHPERGTRQPYRLMLARIDGGLRVVR